MFLSPGKIFSDQTGRFPIQSSCGNKYVVIMYVYDANAILSYPIKNRSTGELSRVFQLVYAKLQTAGFKLQLHKLDNETPTTLETFIANNNRALQYTPPEIHRTNAGKHAVQMWKNRFKMSLTSLPKQFPIAHWCHLTTQCDITLNMLHPYQQNPKLSAQEALNGTFHFDVTPMVPPGTTCCVQIKHQSRTLWGLNILDAFYVGPAMNHYWYYQTIIPATGAEHISDTIIFQHHSIQTPHVLPTDCIVQAAQNLEHAINGFPLALVTQ